MPRSDSGFVVYSFFFKPIAPSTRSDDKLGLRLTYTLTLFGRATRWTLGRRGEIAFHTRMVSGKYMFFNVAMSREILVLFLEFAFLASKRFVVTNV